MENNIVSLENNFKIELRQNEESIYTSIFESCFYSPKTLSAIDVRSVLSNIFKNINNISSRKTYNTTYSNYNLLDEYIHTHKINNIVESKLDLPPTKTIEINGKTIKGVELCLIFYINNKIIFERTVYVDKYNPNFRFSMELHETMKDIQNTLMNEIKKIDIVNIYNDNREYLNG